MASFVLTDAAKSVARLMERMDAEDRAAFNLLIKQAHADAASAPAAAPQEAQPVAWRWRRNQDGALWSNWRGVGDEGVQIPLEDVRKGPNVIEFAYPPPQPSGPEKPHDR